MAKQLLDLTKLKYFVEAARVESILQASRSLSVSQSTVWHAINDLEQQLDQKLFLKTGRSIVLTDHGKFLAGRASALLEHSYQLADEVRGSKILEGHFRIAAPSWLLNAHLIPIWMNSFKSSANVSVEFRTMRSAQVIDEVVGGTADFGVCFSTQGHPQIDTMLLKQGEMQFYVRTKHALFSNEQTERLAELRKLNAVLPKALAGMDDCQRHPCFQELHLYPSRSFLYDQYDTALAILESSDAWGFFPEIVGENAKGISPVDFEEEFEAPYTIRAVWNRERQFHPVLRHFLADVSQHFFTQS